MESWNIAQVRVEKICEYLLAPDGVTSEPIVCFDYFDTLVVRTVEPEYTKILAAELLSQALGRLLSARELYGRRSELERIMCRENVDSGGELEFYLGDLAGRLRTLLAEELGAHPLLQDEQGFVRLMLDIETTVELWTQQPCRETIAVLRQLKQAERTTVLISDFYLPGSCFRQMLEHVQIHDLFDQVYISADYGLAKGSGRLYEKVCADLQCDPARMIMIGDNKHADVTMAKHQGLRAVHVQNPEQKSLYEQWQAEELTDADRVEQRFAGAWKARGPFREISLTLWYFTWLLFQELSRRRITDVFFFSKEGEFLKKIFDRLQNDLFGGSVITSHYLLVSRKATFLASLRPLPEEDFSRLFPHYRDISLRDFLLSLNFEESLAQSICDQAGLEYQTRYLDLGNTPEFQKLLDLERFRQVYESRRSSQRNNFIAYLDSFGVNYAADGLAIVDVGWKGSIQDNLYYILREQIQVQGFFIGSLIATEKKEQNTKKGLLFDDTPQQTPYFNVYNNNRSLFEMMLGASHGSADGYFTPEQFAQLPDDHQREITRRLTTERGEILVATLDLPEERTLFEQKIRPIQDQVYQDAGRLNKACLGSSCSLPTPEWFARQHARMVFAPTRSEVDFFESLYHLENFGIFEYTDFRTHEKLSLKQRWTNLKNLRRNSAILEMGTWPPIVLRRLGIGPYRYLDGRQRYKSAFDLSSKAQDNKS